MVSTFRSLSGGSCFESAPVDRLLELNFSAFPPRSLQDIVVTSLFNMSGPIYRGADKSLARSTSHCILFDGEYISFDASLVIYI